MGQGIRNQRFQRELIAFLTIGDVRGVRIVAGGKIIGLQCESAADAERLSAALARRFPRMRFDVSIR